MQPNGVDAIIARVQYDLTGDQMRAMRECDDKQLREELARLICERDEARDAFGSETKRLHAEVRELRQTVEARRTWVDPETINPLDYGNTRGV